jgi:hypothetical protein
MTQWHRKATDVEQELPDNLFTNKLTATPFPIFGIVP